jgi:hypothetical protein
VAKGVADGKISPEGPRLAVTVTAQVQLGVAAVDEVPVAAVVAHPAVVHEVVANEPAEFVP